MGVILSKVHFYQGKVLDKVFQFQQERGDFPKGVQLV